MGNHQIRAGFGEARSRPLRERWADMHKSVFVKLVAIMATMAACLLLLVSGFFWLIVSPNLNTAVDRLEGYTRKLAASSADFETAKRLGARLDLQVRYEGRDGSWSTGLALQVVPQPKAWRIALPWAVAAAALIVATAVVGLWAPWRSLPAPQPVRFTVAPTGALPIVTGGPYRDLALSPDGTRLVYVAGTDAPNKELWVRAVDQVNAVHLRGLNNPNSPFISPDSEWIGFASANDLMKVCDERRTADSHLPHSRESAGRELGQERHDCVCHGRPGHRLAHRAVWRRRPEGAHHAGSETARDRSHVPVGAAGRPGRAVHDYDHDRARQRASGGVQSEDR